MGKRDGRILGIVKLQGSSGKYTRDLMIALFSFLALSITMRAFGKNICSLNSDFWLLLIILVDYLLFLIAVKIWFTSIEISDIYNGTWAGLVLYCWAPILDMDWLIDPLVSAQKSALFFLIGLIVAVIGFFLSRYAFRVHDD